MILIVLALTVIGIIIAIAIYDHYRK